MNKQWTVEDELKRLEIENNQLTIAYESLIGRYQYTEAENGRLKIEHEQMLELAELINQTAAKLKTENVRLRAALLDIPEWVEIAEWTYDAELANYKAVLTCPCCFAHKIDGHMIGCQKQSALGITNHE